MKPYSILVILMMALTISVPKDALSLNVVATTPDLASIARAIGGDRANVLVLATGTQDPHFLDPQPGLVVDLNRADLLLYTGLELEVGWLPVLLTGSANPRIQAGQSGHLNCSVAVERKLEVPERATREMGDVHPLGNPHYMINPNNARRVARVIAGSMIELDPAGAEVYSQNLRQFLIQLDQRIEAWQERMAPHRGTEILVYHKDWSYLVDWLGLRVAGTLEPLPGIPPSPAHLADLIIRHRGGSVRALLMAPWDALRTGREVSQQLDIPFLVLPSQPGSMPEAQDYISMLDLLIDRLATGLESGE